MKTLSWSFSRRRGCWPSCAWFRARRQVPDCDEVFNYWEPLHFLHHGFGLQTWEYAPEFSLRSYFPVTPSHRSRGWPRWSVRAPGGPLFDSNFPGSFCACCEAPAAVKRTVGSATSSSDIGLFGAFSGNVLCRPDAAALHFCNVLSDAVLCRLAEGACGAQFSCLCDRCAVLTLRWSALRAAYFHRQYTGADFRVMGPAAFSW